MLVHECKERVEALMGGGGTLEGGGPLRTGGGGPGIRSGGLGLPLLVGGGGGLGATSNVGRLAE